MKQWLRHAFALDDPQDIDPTEEQQRVVDKLCRWVVQRQMTVSVLVALESCRGLNYFGSQAMHFLRPSISVLFDHDEYQQFALFLEHRGSIDYLCRRLEHWKETDERDRS